MTDVQFLSQRGRISKMNTVKQFVEEPSIRRNHPLTRFQFANVWVGGR